MAKPWREDSCQCQICKSGKGSYYNKYGRPHHGACMCDKCVRSHSQHNARMTCECDDCKTHNHYLYNNDAKRDTRRAIAQGKPVPGRNTRVATINLCGRKGCNAMMTSDAAGVIQLWKRPDDEDSRAFELCPACVADVVRTLEATDIGQREQAYKEPYQEPKSGDSDPLSGLSDADLARAYMRRVAENGELVKELDQ